MRLLLVDDEVRLAAALQRGLTAEGFAVDVAHDGPSALALARSASYDVMVLDIMLPGLSGYRVVEALRKDGNDVPVLLLSAKDGEYDQADGLDLGADDYLTKPFSFVVLVARLRALLRRGGATAPAVLVVGALRLDPGRREVSVGGDAVTLTAREFGLLEYLMRRPGQVVTRTELLDHVWDAPMDVDPNVVEVYVGYLRKKLGVAAVQTVRGVGYRVAAA